MAIYRRERHLVTGNLIFISLRPLQSGRYRFSLHVPVVTCISPSLGRTRPGLASLSPHKGSNLCQGCYRFANHLSFQAMRSKTLSKRTIRWQDFSISSRIRFALARSFSPAFFANELLPFRFEVRPASPLHLTRAFTSFTSPGILCMLFSFAQAFV